MTLTDKTHQLKMFIGETPTTALKRFCGMLKLNTIQCHQVKLAYHELCVKNSIIDTSLEKELSETNPNSQPSKSRIIDETSEENSVEDEQSSFELGKNNNDMQSKYDGYPPLMKRLLELSEEYWNIIALIIVVLYIATEHLP